MNAQFARFCPKQITGNSDDIPDIEDFVKLIGAYPDGILFYIDLKLFAILLQMQKASLPHAPYSENAARNARGRVHLVGVLVKLCRICGIEWVKSKAWP